MLGDTLEHKGIRWGFCFLLADSKLSHDHCLALVRHAVEMYYAKEAERVLDGVPYSGRIIQEGEHAMLGAFSGRQYGADVETARGKARVRFIVREYTGPAHSVFSKN